MADLKYEITFLGRQIQEMADQFERDGKEWKNDADRDRFDELGVKLADAKRSHQPSGRIPGQIDTIPSGNTPGLMVGQATTHGGDGSYFDIDLTEVPGLSKRDSFAEHVGGDTSREMRGLTIGGLCRAAVLGASNDVESRALAEGTDSAGGYTVPTLLSGQVIDNLRALSVVNRAGATTVPLDSMNNDFARLDTDPTATWHSENASVSDNSPTFGQVRFQPQVMVSLVRASRELIEDARGFDDALRKAFAGSFAAEMDRVALYGTGSAPQPEGVKNVTGIGSVDMGTNGEELTDYDPLSDAWLEVAQDDAPDLSAFIMAPRTRSELAKLKDGQSQPAQRPELISRVPFLTTTNIPIDETQGSASDASTILTGHWPHLVIGIRRNIHIQVLKERFSDNLQYGFLASMRMDTKVWHPESFAEIVGIIP